MTSRVSVRAILLACSATWAALPSAASAQANEGDSASISEIIVTAARDSRRLKDVPMSVDVATGDELQKFNLFDAKDIQRLSPGLEMSNDSGRSNTTTLRGVSFNPDQGTGPAVQTYLNEVPVDPQYAFTAIYDIQQVEVLRGPQGSLRGASAPAGAITMTTRRPSFTSFDGYVQATATNRHGYNVQGGVSLPFSDTFAVRVAALVDGNRLNNVYNVTRGERSRSRTESARITLDWRPTSDFEAVLTYQYLHADNRQNQQVFGPGNNPITLAPFQVGTQDLGGGFVVPIVIFGPASTFDPAAAALRSGPAATAKDRIAVSDGLQRFQNNFHLVNLNLNWDLGPARLSVIAAHTFALLSQRQELDPGNAVVGRDLFSIPRIPNKIDSIEARIESTNTEGFGGGLSAFYSKRTGKVTVDEDRSQFFLPVPLTSNLSLPVRSLAVVPVFSENYSIAGNLRYRSGPLTVEGSLRYAVNNITQKTDLFLSSPGFTTAFDVGGGAFLLIPVGGGTVFPPNGSVQQVGVPENLQNRTYKPLTGAASVTYQVSPDVSVYAAYGHSYRSGSAIVAAPAGLSDDIYLSKPEKTDSFEIGLKGSVFDRRLSFGIAAYYQKYDGFLNLFGGIFYNCRETNSVCSPTGAPINNATDVPATNGQLGLNYNGDAIIKGIEATLDGRVTDNWDIGINLSYAHGRYDDALLPCNDFAGTGVPNQTGTPRITGTGNISLCKSNDRLADIPDFSASVTTELRFPVGKVTPFVRGLLSYRPSVYSIRNNFQYQDRELVDVYLGIRGEDGRWEINAFAKNVLNQQRITNISNGNAVVGSYDSGYRLINTTNPREFGMTTSFKF